MRNLGIFLMMIFIAVACGPDDVNEPAPVPEQGPVGETGEDGLDGLDGNPGKSCTFTRYKRRWVDLTCDGTTVRIHGKILEDDDSSE